MIGFGSRELRVLAWRARVLSWRVARARAFVARRHVQMLRTIAETTCARNRAREIASADPPFQSIDEFNVKIVDPEI